MHNFVSFLMEHWTLSLLFLILLVAFVYIESQSSGGGLNVSPTEAINLMNNHSATIIDVRDVSAFQAGHLINAKSIPESQVLSDIPLRIKNKSQTIILVSSGKNQLLKLVQSLKKVGYDKVSILSGGIEEWKRQDFPLVSGKK